MLEGLQNIGNTCSINTLVQCVGHSATLRKWLLSMAEEARAEGGAEGGEAGSGQLRLSMELSRITREMWVENKSLAPFRFIRAIFGCLGGIPRGEQHDMMELWMLLVDKMNSEIGRPHDAPRIEGGRDAEGFAKAWSGHNGRCMSPWLQQVQGWTMTRICCQTCKKDAVMYEPFCCLGLDLYPGDETKDMSRMFDSMFKEEQITERACDHCHGRAPATKNTHICMYPDVLVCSFGRFEMTASGDTRKRHDAIDIPLHIKPAQIDRQYTLCSIGNHLGSLHGGHYYATARNPDGSWHNYDDICISPVHDIHATIKNNKDAYMLFYELGAL